MKFGLLIDFGNSFCNYGDYIQSIAIEYVYRQMGIPEEEIIHISVKQLSTYDGEQLLLPYSYVLYYLMDQRSGTVNISEKITVVFLGASVEFAMHVSGYSLENILDPQKKWLELLRKFAPVGCRDAYTVEFLRKAGIPAYLQGCITNALPRRAAGEYKEVLLVDCPKEFLPYIPSALLKNAKAMSNAGHNESQTMQENYRRIKQRYIYYRKHARMVITSRYHVATPCNAMGIPSVFVRRAFDKHTEDIRMDTLNPNIQMCSAENHSHINWNPVWIDFAEMKESIMELAAARIKEAYLRHIKVEEITHYYRSRIKQYSSIDFDSENSCLRRLRHFITKHHLSSAGKLYVWGATPFHCSGDTLPLAQYVAEINPQLEFAGWIDSFKEGTLARKKIYRPKDVHLSENDIIIVMADTAAASAREYAREERLSEKQCFIFVNEMVEEADLAQFVQ